MKWMMSVVSVLILATLGRAQTAPVIAPVVFSPSDSIFNGPIEIEMTCATPGVKIWYTLGIPVDPNPGSPSNVGLLYSEKVLINQSASFSLWAVAFDSTGNRSITSKKKYKITVPVNNSKSGRIQQERNKKEPNEILLANGKVLSVTDYKIWRTFPFLSN